jgi:hypothetical protein
MAMNFKVLSKSVSLKDLSRISRQTPRLPAEMSVATCKPAVQFGVTTSQAPLVPEALSEPMTLADQSAPAVPSGTANPGPHKTRLLPNLFRSSPMKNPDGITFQDYTSFTDDVLGQISRKKLKLGDYEDQVRKLLPEIESVMTQLGITYEHCGLNARARGQVSLVRIEGLLHRMSIYQSQFVTPEGVIRLGLDAHWSGINGAGGTASESIILSESTRRSDILKMMKDYIAEAAAEQIIRRDLFD